MSPLTSHCPHCHTPLPRDAPRGLCPECLLLGGFEENASAAATSPGAPRESTIHIVVPLDEPGGVPEALRHFGDYELLDEIAVGGMGVVFKARQRSLNRLVAVKMIRAGHLAREADIRRFRAEAEATANLKHPNIVAIHEVGEHQGRHYFSMDYIEGRSLADLVRDHPLDPAQAAELVQTVAEAIAYAHQRGVLHRDLKPSNVMIDAHGQPHVTDFGLAKMLHGDSELTQTGAVLGSPSYMSPEQARGRGDQVSVRSDVYALGAMLYELLTARPPFLAATPLETIKRVAEREPVAPRVLNPSVPRDLETIALKCLQKEPAHRYGSARELTEELRRFLRGEPIHARPSTVLEQGVKWAQRHPARAALIAMCVLAPALVIVVLSVMGTKLTRERNHALQQEQKAGAAAARAEAGERDARERAYAADLYAAFQALAVDDLALARRLLHEHRPPPIPDHHSPVTDHPSRTPSPPPASPDPELAARNPTDLRGFEWRVLWERTRGQEAFAFTNLSRPTECLVFAPDGRTLVSGGDDGIHLWDVAGGRPLGQFPGPDPGRPDGNRAPTREGLRPLLDASPAVVEHLTAHPGLLDYLDSFGHTNRTRTVNSLAFTPDGQHLLVGSTDLVRSWTFATRTFDFAIPEKEATVATSAVGDHFVVANNQLLDPDDERQTAHPQSALVYSFSRRRLVARLPGFGLRAVVAPDGEHIAAASRTNGVVLWRPATGERTPLSLDARSSSLLSFSPDSKTLLLRLDSHQPPMLWEVESKRIKAYLKGEHIHLGAVAWSPDGRILAGGGENRNIGLWKVPAGVGAAATNASPAGPLFLVPDAILRGHEDTVKALAFSPDGRWLASAANDHSIRFWPIAREPDLATAPGVTPVLPMTPSDVPIFSETGTIVGRVGKKLALLDPQQGYVPRDLPGTARHFPTGFLDSGQGFVAVEMTTNGVPAHVEIRRSSDGAVQTRRPILPAPRELQSSGVSWFLFLASDPAGTWLAVAQTNAERVPDVHVFAIDTGRFVARLPGWPRALLWNLRASPDGRWLARFDHLAGTNRIAIYDTHHWRLVREWTFRSAGFDVNAASIDPTSRFIATGGSGQNSLRVWDLHTGCLEGHCLGNVNGWQLPWSKDGRTLVARDSGGLRFWSTVVFRELALLPVATHSVHLPLGFTAADRALVGLTMDGRGTAWSPPTLAEIDRPPQGSSMGKR